MKQIKNKYIAQLNDSTRVINKFFTWFDDINNK